jgi:translation initiation factor 1
VNPLTLFKKPMKKPKTKGLVYSTDTGRTCPSCGHSIKQCCCSNKPRRQQGDGVVRVSRQTKGRKGSGVSLIIGVPLGEAELKKLAKQLKKICGSGGTVKNGVIEIQGDHRVILVKTLISLGYKTKQAGG